MDKIKLVAILRGIRPAEAAEHIATLVGEGFRYIEIPLNSPDWRQSIPQMVARFGEQAVIGAGTVLKVEQVDFLADAGAEAYRDAEYSAGGDSPGGGARNAGLRRMRHATEAFSALDAGAQWLKIFPSSAFGPDYIRALKAVLPRGTGAGGRRRDAGESGELVRAGCAGAGLGSDLYRAGRAVGVPVSRRRGLSPPPAAP